MISSCVGSSPSNSPCNDSFMCLHLVFSPKPLHLALTHLFQFLLVLKAVSHVRGSAVEFHCCNPQQCQCGSPSDATLRPRSVNVFSNFQFSHLSLFIKYFLYLFHNFLLWIPLLLRKKMNVNEK